MRRCLAGCRVGLLHKISKRTLAMRKLAIVWLDTDYEMNLVNASCGETCTKSRHARVELRVANAGSATRTSEAGKSEESSGSARIHARANYI